MKTAELFHKGAEASLYRGEWFGRQVVIKIRHARKYRHPQLDYKLRVTRTAREANIISATKKAGVKVPLIFEIDFQQTALIMEYIAGDLLRDAIATMSEDTLEKLFTDIGVAIGRLHNFRIIHGDLTTSNMIYTLDHQICFIDFGLAGISSETESRGVDLLLAKRTLGSTHPAVFELCYEALIDGYSKIVPSCNEVISKIAEIESRGRYVERPPTRHS
jgi:Kae1-associated kinase Bud32